MCFPQLNQRIIKAISEFMETKDISVRKSIYVNLRQVNYDNQLHKLLLPALLERFVHIVDENEIKIFNLTLSRFLDNYPIDSFLEIFKVSSYMDDLSVIKMNRLLKEFESGHPNIISTNEAVNSALLTYSENVISNLRLNSIFSTVYFFCIFLIFNFI